MEEIRWRPYENLGPRPRLQLLSRASLCLFRPQPVREALVIQAMEDITEPMQHIMEGITHITMQGMVGIIIMAAGEDGAALASD